MSDTTVQSHLALVAEADQPRLLESLQAYLTELGAESDYPHFELYWRERSRYPYWIKVAGNDVGFALVRRREDGVFEVAEFYVAAHWRRKGVGLASAKALFATHPGSWEIASFPRNRISAAFWAKAVPPGAQQFKDTERSVFSFTVGDAD